MDHIKKLGRRIFGGSQEVLRQPQDRRGPHGQPFPSHTPLGGSTRNGLPHGYHSEDRPSSSPANYGANYRGSQNRQSHGTTAAHIVTSSSQAPATPPRLAQTFNVILFGEAGVGKSAVVNLIAGRNIAQVSPDANGCTMQSTPYDVVVDGIPFRIFDTVGLNQGDTPELKAHVDAVGRAYGLIRGLKDAGGVHLLLFCMRGSRVTSMAEKNYRLFAEFLCQRRVSVAVVATCLEQEIQMEDWWTRNGSKIEEMGIKSIDHACVTTVKDERKFAESQQDIRKLLKDCYSLSPKAFVLDESTGLAMAETGMRNLHRDGKKLSKDDIEKMLSKRLRISKKDLKRILNTIGNSGTSTSK